MRSHSALPWKLCHEHDGTYIRNANGGLVARLEAGCQAMRNYDGEAIIRLMNAPGKRRLEYLRHELRAERISYGELNELQSLIGYIEPDDVELLEAAGVPEF
jgi:hypothetical protein